MPNWRNEGLTMITSVPAKLRNGASWSGTADNNANTYGLWSVLSWPPGPHARHATTHAIGHAMAPPCALQARLIRWYDRAHGALLPPSCVERAYGVVHMGHFRYPARG